MQATIQGVRPFGPFDSVLRFEATIQETGEDVLIGVDHRPAGMILEAMASGVDEIEVDIEPWQILGRVS